MTGQDSTTRTLQRRERYRDWYITNRDPISDDRLLWQAQLFRHLVHLLPGESILEIGSGGGFFTQPLKDVSRKRNTITAVRFDAETDSSDDGGGCVEHIHCEEFPGSLTGRTFDYVVMQNMLDREIASELLSQIYDFLKPGGQMVIIESNPWNPLFIVRAGISRLLGRERQQWLVNRPDLYEQISEIGFIRVSAHFTDFVYWPLTGVMCRLVRNASVILENTPFLRTLAGRILVHAQKPPRTVERAEVSLATHEALKNKVSVVVPCHNEEMNVGSLVAGLTKYYGDYLHQIVLVDDNSTDGTQNRILEIAEKDPRITLVSRQPPNGVGHAIREGYEAATGEYILSMDCDFQHLLPELEDMFDAIADGFDAAVGSRFSRHSILINYPIGKIIANRGFHVCFSLLFRSARRDLTNNLKLMRSDLVRRMTLVEPWFAVNAETGLQLALMDCRLKEVPVSWVNRTFDMGQSTFRVLGAGGGYLRVLVRLFMETRAGTRKLASGRSAAED